MMRILTLQLFDTESFTQKTKKTLGENSKLHTTDLFAHIYYWQISALVLDGIACPHFIATCEPSKNQFVSPQASRPP